MKLRKETDGESRVVYSTTGGAGLAYFRGTLLMCREKGDNSIRPLT